MKTISVEYRTRLGIMGTTELFMRDNGKIMHPNKEVWKIEIHLSLKNSAVCLEFGLALQYTRA